MKMKTSELTGPALDWAVAKCEGVKVSLSKTGFLIYLGERIHIGPQGRHYTPSTNWSQGGPIIDREKIDLYHSTGRNAAAIWENLPGGGRLIAESKDTPTILTAAMRCYVASKLGDEVEIPDELTGE